MELVWNNPSPDRTVDRPAAWEVIGRDGTKRVFSTDEVQAIADRKIAHRANDATHGMESLVSLYFCF